jgi:hypothetical protein
MYSQEGCEVQDEEGSYSTSIPQQPGEEEFSVDSSESVEEDDGSSDDYSLDSERSSHGSTTEDNMEDEEL